MKLFYVANIRIPTEKAHGIQIMSTCESFAKTGIEVNLLVPYRANKIKFDPFVFYKTNHRFNLSVLPSIDLFFLGFYKPLVFTIQIFSFLVSIIFYFLFFRLSKNNIIYGRDEIILAILSLFSSNVFWESHTGSNNFFAKILLKRAKGIICISEGLVDFYKEKVLDSTKIIIARDAVDKTLFDKIEDDKLSIRKLLGLPINVSIVTYSGSIGLYTWKGVDTLLDSFRFIKRQDIRLLIIGGSDFDVNKIKSNYNDSRIIFLGRIDHGTVPLYLKASDFLVIPNKPGDTVSEKYTSPMKLFEYMASKRQIIASDLPSIREVLETDEAVFFEAGNPSDLASKIEFSINNETKASHKAQLAYSKVSEYTWDNRVSKILNFLNK